MAIIKQYNKVTDTTYVYESTSYWVPELKQSRSKRTCIGKIDPETGEIVPTGKGGRKKKAPDDAASLATTESKLKQATCRLEEAEKEIVALKLKMVEQEDEFLKKDRQKQKEIQNLTKQIQKLESVLNEVQSLVNIELE